MTKMYEAFVSWQRILVLKTRRRMIQVDETIVRNWDD